MESATEHFDHVEHAQHAAHSKNSFDSKVAMTVAVLAVVAATIGSLEAIESSSAVSAKSEAVLHQNRATDKWNFFSTKSIKKNMYDIASAEFPTQAADFQAKARKNEAEGAELIKEAQELEHQSEQRLEAGLHHEHRHHHLTFAATLVHIAIAIATIAIITGGKRWPWYGSIGLGTVGAILAAVAYLG